MLLSYCVVENHGTLSDFVGECEEWVKYYLHIEDVMSDQEIGLDEIKII
jgi:hypothetical protein